MITYTLYTQWSQNTIIPNEFIEIDHCGGGGHHAHSRIYWN